VIEAELARAQRGAVPLDETLVTLRQEDAADVWATAVGTAYHRAWQEELLPLLSGATLLGWWERDFCMSKDLDEVVTYDGRLLRGIETVRGKLQAGPLSYAAIPRPEGEGWRYVELAFCDGAHNLTGHCDGILRWADGAEEVFELKTVSPHSFKLVDPAVGGVPFAEHVVQVQMYMHWAGLPRGRLLYVRKEADAAVGALAEHVVRADPAVVAEVHATVLAVREALATHEEWWQGGGVGDKPLWPWRLEHGCRYKGDRRARLCPQRGACFVRGTA
jgi:hypothetical protein